MSATGEHVPWIKIEEGHEEVDTHCGAGRDDEIGEDIIAEMERRRWALELYYHDVDGCKDRVRHDDGVGN